MSLRHSARSRDTGFTLIELLVVISIISLLIALLLPALRQARETARGMACLSNARQVAMAITLYCDDHGGQFPPVLLSNPTRYWTELIVRDGGYLTTLQVFDCPSFESTNVVWLSPPSGWWGEGSANWRRTELGYNVDYLGGSRFEPLSDPAKDVIPARINEIAKPSETIVLADSVRLDVLTGWNGVFSYFHPTSGHATPRHQQSVNVAWVDGHASRVSSSNPIDAYAADSLTSRFDGELNKWDRK